MNPMRALFRKFWRSLPLSWQAGFLQAQAGGAWRGSLDPAAPGETGIVVYFVHPSFVSRIDRVIEGGRQSVN